MQSLEKVVKGQRRNCPVPLMGHHLLGYLKKYIYIGVISWKFNLQMYC